MQRHIGRAAYKNKYGTLKYLVNQSWEKSNKNNVRKIGNKQQEQIDLSKSAKNNKKTPARTGTTFTKSNNTNNYISIPNTPITRQIIKLKKRPAKYKQFERKRMGKDRH